jgi:transcription antitermination protein NusB
MTTSRHEKRCLVIQALFMWEGREKDANKALEYVCKEFDESIENDRSFEQALLHGTIKHIDETKKLIAKYAPEWPVEKIAPTDRVILYLALYELAHTDTPNAVVINEAVELAKEFGGDKSYKFINGALSSANKALESKKKS